MLCSTEKSRMMEGGKKEEAGPSHGGATTWDSEEEDPPPAATTFVPGPLLSLKDQIEKDKVRSQDSLILFSNSKSFQL